MNFLTLSLLVLSGFLHATWNFLGKSSKDKLSFFFLIKVAQAVIYLPVVIYILKAEHFSSKALPFVMIGGIIHVFYWLCLSLSYTYADLSVVYPIARSAPAFIPVFSYLILKERFSAAGILGIALVSVGVYLLTFERGKFLGTLKRIFNLKEKGIVYSYITLLTVIAFSLNDKMAANLVNPVAYVYLFELVSLSLLTPIVVASRKKEVILSELKNGFLPVIAGGILIILSYSLTVYALKSSSVAYATSVRQVGILFGSLYGVAFLKENLGARRILAALLITAGIVIIGIFA